MGLKDWLKGRAAAPPRPTAAPSTRPAQPQRRASTPSFEPPTLGRGPTAKAAAAWVPLGQSVTVAGFALPGMVYVGKNVVSVGHRGVEPSLIDPSSPVDTRRPDHAGQGMGYWPSYRQIPAGSRAAYLSWLAGGRGSGAYIGYVFLYFYGLERRALFDAQIDPAANADLPAIAQEVQRLLGLYSDNRSFHGYASAFLDTLQVLTATGSVLDGPPPESVNYWELPARLKVGLGQLAAAAMPIPADWALAWVRCHPDERLRTPAKRCPEEFSALFAHRYYAEYGAGLVVKANKTKLSVNYRPASAGFGGSVDVTLGDLPDVSALTAPVRKLAALAQGCTDDLDAYSRWLGRNPDGAGSLASLGLLPALLVAQSTSTELRRLHDWAETQLADASPVVVRGEELLTHWPSTGGKLNKAESIAMCSLLDHIGYGVEPDVRFGGATLSSDPVVLFRLDSSEQVLPGLGYAAATVLLHLAAVVSAADGAVTHGERDHLHAHLETALHLSAGERRRLDAHLAWLVATKPGVAGMKKRLDLLDGVQRATIASFLVGVAGADGTVSPAEINALTKMFTLLGVDPTEVYSQIHALGGPAPGPVTVRPSRPVAPGEPIPAPTQPSTVVTLDPARVQARMEESAEVAALLATVFIDDEPVPVLPSEPPQDDDTIPGLDAAHTAMVHALATKETWTSEELAALASASGLLPAGAVDTINEASLELSGEPLCEATGDGVEINGYALGEMLR